MDPLPEIGLAVSARSRLSWAQLSALAGEAEEAGARWIFVNEAGNDALLSASAVVSGTGHARVGIGVLNIYLRHPCVVAASALFLAEQSQGRFALGLGVGHAAVNESRLGLSMNAPLSRLLEYVAVIRGVIADPTFRLAGSHYTVSGPELTAPPGTPTPPLFAAVLQPRAMRTISPHIDGVIINFPLPEYVRMLRDSRTADAEQSGNPLCVAYVHVVLPSHVSAERRQEARRLVATYGRFPNYREMMKLQGFDDDAERLRIAWEAGDVARAQDAPSDALVEALVPSDDLRKCLADLRRAGVDVAVLHPSPPEGHSWTAAYRDALEIIEELAE